MDAGHIALDLHRNVNTNVDMGHLFPVTCIEMHFGMLTHVNLIETTGVGDTQP